MGRRSSPDFVRGLIRRIGDIVHHALFTFRREIPVEFTISVSMEVEGNERQMLGFVELKGPAFYDGPKEWFGK
jgi:hypothetical protein